MVSGSLSGTAELFGRRCTLSARSEAGPLLAEILVAGQKRVRLTTPGRYPPASPCLEASALPEGECVRLGAGLVEGDLERSLADPVMLAYKLIQAAVPNHAVSVLVDVDTR